MNLYFTLKNGKTTPFFTGEGEVTDVRALNKIPLTNRELARFNKLMKDEKTRQIFWEIYERACGEPAEAFCCALHTSFKIYPDGSDEKYDFAVEMFENNYHDLIDEKEQDFDPDFFLKNELEGDDSFFWISGDLVEILWL